MSIEFKPYNDNESIIHFMRRVEDHKYQHKSTKYSVILDFLNKSIINKKRNYSTLTDFKSVSHTELAKNESYFKKTLKHYNNKLANDLDLNPVELLNIFSDDDSDDEKQNDNKIDNIVEMKIEQLYIISYLQKILDVIDFTIISKLSEGIIYYSIKNKPRKTKVQYDESELVRKINMLKSD